jgi:AraC-like DNA-binding protein
VPHEGGVLDARGWYYRAMYVGPAAFRRLSETVFERCSVIPFFSRNILDDTALAERIVAVHRMLEVGDTCLTRETALLETLVPLLERHAMPRPTLPNLGDERGPIRRVVAVMNDRLVEDLSVTELASVAGMSEFHFIRAFRKELGLPPHAYLTQLRLRAAQGLLRERRSLADAALGAGFYDQSHLTKHFKRTYGITPAQYAASLA